MATTNRTTGAGSDDIVYRERSSWYLFCEEAYVQIDQHSYLHQCQHCLREVEMYFLFQRYSTSSLLDNESNTYSALVFIINNNGYLPNYDY